MTFTPHRLQSKSWRWKRDKTAPRERRASSSGTSRRSYSLPIAWTAAVRLPCLEMSQSATTESLAREAKLSKA
jgi:hypothetical protein